MQKLMFMNVVLRVLLIMGIAIICMSCFCAPVYIFTDCYYLPKLYLFMIGMSLIIIPFFLSDYRISDIVSDSLRLFYVIYIIMSEYECAYVFNDIIRRGYCMIGEYGTFDNPAGLALTLCIALSIIMSMLRINHRRYIKYLLIIGCIPIVVVIFYTKSRVGIICLSINVLMFVRFLVYHFFSEKIMRNVFLTSIAIFLFTLVAFYVFYNKSESTKGRKFILEQSFIVINRHPVVGYGSDGFQKEYMLQQANYFKKNRNSIFANKADEVQHPMNEFVFLWVNYGILGSVLLILIFIIPFVPSLRKKLGIAQDSLLPLCVVIIFSLFSYPFHYQSSWFVIFVVYNPVLGVFSRIIKMSHKFRILTMFFVEILLIFSLTIDIYYEFQWRIAEKMSMSGNHKESIEMYGDLYVYFRDNRFFLYSYAMAAFMGGDMQTARNVINECRLHWNGYAIELLSGDISLYLRDYKEAQNHFCEAYYMCPVRFAPLEGLYKVYSMTGNELKKDSIAEKIATKRVKVESAEIERIKETCR